MALIKTVPPGISLNSARPSSLNNTEENHEVMGVGGCTQNFSSCLVISIIYILIDNKTVTAMQSYSPRSLFSKGYLITVTSPAWSGRAVEEGTAARLTGGLVYQAFFFLPVASRCPFGQSCGSLLNFTQ